MHRSLLTLALLASLQVSTAWADHPYGIDVSDYQSPSLNWVTLKNTYGVTFAWAKAMEGTCASCGGDNWPTYCANAKAAGIYIGPYHFARYDSHPGTNGAISEANAFWDTVSPNMKADGLTLIPMLDVEASFTGQTKATLSLWVDTWCTTVSNRAAAVGLNCRPSIYTSSSAANTYFDSSVTKWITDIAEWHDAPNNHANALANAQNSSPKTAPWPTWQFWQYDDQNVAQAITTGDGDIFNGTLQEMTNTMLITSAGPQIASQPKSQTVFPGTNISFTVSASGSGTLHYQWKYNSTNISGATKTVYALTNVQLANAGGYSVLITDASPTSTASLTASLGILQPLTNSVASVIAPVGLMDWWPGDGHPNDIFSTHHSAPVGGVYYSSPGVVGQAFHFDGSTSYLNLSNLTGIPVPWTFCLWVNRQNTPQVSAALLSDGTNSIKLEQYNAAHNLGFTIENATDYTFSPTYSVPIGTWVHLAFVGTANGTVVYANGVQKGSLTNVFALPRGFLGATFNSSASSEFIDFMLGSMDEIMMFNTNLTTAQISAIYSAGPAGVVRAPRIVSTGRNGLGQFYFNMQGQTGKNFTVYSSTDLKIWSNLGNLSNPNGTNFYTDTHSTTSARRFYRVMQTY